MSEINKKGPVPLFEEWIRKYGDIVGFYNGAIPVLLVKDLDLVQRIQITDFSKFHDRGVLSVETQTHKVSKNNLVNATGENWKKMRRILTSAFTPSKMQKLECSMEQTCNEFLEDLELIEGQKKAVEIRRVFQKLSLTMTVRAALGDQAVEQLSENGTGLDVIMKELDTYVSSFSGGWQSFVFNCFPEVSVLWRCITWFMGALTEFPKERVLKIMLPVINERRRSHKTDQKDMLQLMLDAEIDKGDKGRENGKHERFLNDCEIQANVFSGLIDGFETLPTAMAFTAYLLAKNQHVQERLRNQITESLDKDGGAENILKAEYMDHVIHEALRLYIPLAGFISRTCGEDYDFHGLKIPAGMAVIIPAYSLHYDAKLWSDPQKFDPERFSGENKSHFNPVSYQAFGNGPRACIGMRFGQAALKLTLAKMLAKYKLLLDDRHLKEHSLPLTNSLIFSAPRDGVWIKLEKTGSHLSQ